MLLYGDVKVEKCLVKIINHMKNMSILSTERRIDHVVAPRAVVLPFPRCADGTARAHNTGPSRACVTVAALVEIDMVRRLFQSARLRSDLTIAEIEQIAFAPSGLCVHLQAAALLSALRRCALRPMTFHSPGSRAPSLDELWLVRLLEKTRTGDHGNICSLLGFRIQKNWRRQVARLGMNLAQALVCFEHTIIGAASETAYSQPGRVQPRCKESKNHGRIVRCDNIRA